MENRKPGGNSLGILDSDRQDHVGEVHLIIHGGQDDGAQTIGQLQGDFLGGDDAEGVGQVPDIETDLQFLAVTGDGAAVLGGADGGIGPHQQHLVGEDAADGTRFSTLWLSSFPSDAGTIENVFDTPS